MWRLLLSMFSFRKTSPRAKRWTLASVFVFFLFSICGVLIALWGIAHDLEQIRLTLIQSEVGRIRSHAIRTVANIQDEMHMQTSNDLTYLNQTPYPRRNWQRTFKQDESRLYAAVVDATGKIVLHYDTALEEKQLPAVWYKETLREEDGLEDVVITNEPLLTKGATAYDVQVPIIVKDKLLGTYHSGLSAEWLEKTIAERKSITKSIWVWLLLAMLLFECFAGAALFYASRRIAILNESSKMARTRRYAEIGQLMAGIAHEIRNPLNAMRLNVHVLQRANSEDHAGTPDWSVDREAILQDTQLEIDRVEGLVRILMGYARPDVPRPELLDVRQEIQTTLGFLKPSLERRDILVVARLPEQTLRIEMDRDRLRQVLLNLLNNACEAMPGGGTIEISVRAVEGQVEIAISDQGEGIPVALRERVFEPFFSTKDTGSGLGLAIVRRHVEDAGGVVYCSQAASGGALLTVRIALQTKSENPVKIAQQG